MNNLRNIIKNWERKYHCLVRNPLAEDLVNTALNENWTPPDEMLEFYKLSNGLENEWFRILPIENPDNLKSTWDGVKRANNPEKTRYLNADPCLLKRFFIFADIGGGSCAVFDKDSARIWYQENGDLKETDLGFVDFVDTLLKEVRDL